MNLFWLFLLSFSINFSHGQSTEDQSDKSEEGWKIRGTVSFLFNQAAFNANWQGGGVSNFSGNLMGFYQFDFNKGLWDWDNQLLGEYGLTKIKDQQYSQKTTDRMEYTSTVGKRFENTKWFVSGFLNFKTQFDSGFEETERQADLGNGTTIKVTTRERITKFMSPAYLQLGPGVLWKRDNDMKFNLAPATMRFVFVDAQFTDPDDPRTQLDGKNRYFGVEARETSRFEFGASLNAIARFKLMENITMTNLLNLYSNYLEDPQNVDIDYTLAVQFKINKWFKSSFIVQAIYDDNASRGFQVRETFGLGFTYGFGEDKLNPEIRPRP